MNLFAGQIQNPCVSKRGTIHHQKGRGVVSSHLSGQHWIVKKMKADRPCQPLIPLVKAASDQIADHSQEFVESFPLRRHFRIVTGRHQHVFILFDLKRELFLHTGIVPHKSKLCNETRREKRGKDGQRRAKKEKKEKKGG
ncbi:MAG TPA: hypothetical protein VH595_15670 [Verrucomicrobiae bacterium]|nr:hypothetical protein [Verrucomicrobiae bacterium]